MREWRNRPDSYLVNLTSERAATRLSAKDLLRYQRGKVEIAEGLLEDEKFSIDYPDDIVGDLLRSNYKATKAGFEKVAGAQFANLSGKSKAPAGSQRVPTGEAEGTQLTNKQINEQKNKLIPLIPDWAVPLLQEFEEDAVRATVAEIERERGSGKRIGNPTAYARAILKRGGPDRGQGRGQGRTSAGDYQQRDYSDETLEANIRFMLGSGSKREELVGFLRKQGKTDDEVDEILKRNGVTMSGE